MPGIEPLTNAALLRSQGTSKDSDVLAFLPDGYGFLCPNCRGCVCLGMAASSLLNSLPIDRKLIERRKRMVETEKIAWIDEESRIVSFHAIDSGNAIQKTETLFWDLIYELMNAGYRIM